MRKSKIIIILFFFIFLFVAQNLWAGVYFESEMRNSMDSEVQKTRTFISGTKIKILIDEAYGWIIDLKTSKLIDFDLQNKTFHETSIADMSDELDVIGAKMKIFTEMRQPTDADKRLADELEDTPNELTQFGNSEPPLGKEQEQPFQPILKKVKKKNILLGYKCYLVQIDLSPTERQQLWVSDQIPFAEEALNFWKAFYRNSSFSLKNFLPLKSHFEIMSRLEGFPLSRKAEIKAGGDPYVEEETVTLIEDRNIADDIFSLPPDVQKTEPVIWKQGFDKNLLDRLENHKYNSRGGGEEKI